MTTTDPSSQSGLADQTLTPTPAGQWKTRAEKHAESNAEEGFIVELPTGNVIRMTRFLDMPMLLQTGQIPNPLAGVVQAMIDSGRMNFNQKEISDPKMMMQLLDLVHETIVRAVISPEFDMPIGRNKLMDPETNKKVKETPEAYQERIADWEPQDGKISVFNLDSEDRWYIFSVAQGAAADLATFRTEQARIVADVSTGQRVRAATKRTNGPRSKVKS